MSTPGYRLPCPCGEVIVVQKRQAGQSVSCQACGASQDVPTMRGLEKLAREESAQEDSGKPEKPSEVAPRQSGGCLFSGSLGLGSLLAVAAIVLYIFARSWTPNQTIESSLEQANEQLDTYEFEELLYFWDQVDQSGMGEAKPPWFVLHARIARRFDIGAITCGSIAALAFLIASVMFIRDFRVVRE